ncbi:MAG: serine hydrolase domain-containing protein, partial [Candidatus Sulfomarinibacteraceae bacterium]
MKADDASAVLRLLTRAIRAGMAPGMVAGWLKPHDSDPRCVAAGHASVRPVAEEMTEDRWFDLASLTKVLVITPLVLIALRNQDLSLETRVDQTVPELGGTALGARRIRHLLTHTSGLPAWAPLYAHGGGRDSDAVIRVLAGMRVGEVRGDVVYSCPGFILLGLILERLAGMPLDVLFERHVLGPLSLANEIGFRPGPGTPLVSGACSPDAERALMIERGLEPACIPE